MNHPDLWQHQKEALKISKDRFCFFFDTGTGKTRTALEHYNRVKYLANHEKAIVVAPLTVCRNWIDEVSKFCGVDVHCYLVAGQPLVKKKSEIEKFKRFVGRAFLIINTDSFRVPSLLEALNSVSASMLIIDEAHQFKNPASSRTRGLMNIIQRIDPRFLYLLTGTPTPQGEMDLYVPMRLMNFTRDPFTVWKKKFFVDVNEDSQDYLIRLYEFLWEHPEPFIEVQASNSGEMIQISVKPTLPFGKWRSYLLSTIRHTPPPIKHIWRFLTNKGKCQTLYFEWYSDMIGRLKTFSKFKPKELSGPYFEEFLKCSTMTANKNECLDLPPLLKVKLYGQMSTEQAKAYNEINTEFRSVLASGEVLNVNGVLARIVRLQQIAAGLFGGAGIIESGVNARLEVLDSAIEDIADNQGIIWSIFKPTYQQIAARLKRFGKSFDFITGETPAAERHKVIKRFQAGEIDFIIGNPDAGGIGVNMTAAAYSIHYTKSYDLVDYMQSEARNYRGGSERHEKITQFDILMEGTIDLKVHQALESKRSVQDFILNLKENPNGV